MSKAGFCLFVCFNLTISALTRHLVQLQTLPPALWLPDEELLACLAASALEATLTVSILNLDFVYHGAGNTKETAENEGGGYSQLVISSPVVEPLLSLVVEAKNANKRTIRRGASAVTTQARLIRLTVRFLY